MKEIPLTQGKVAIVDDGDYENLSQFKWYAMKSRYTFYAGRTAYANGTRKTILMHKCIVESMEDIDHKDGDGLNNTRTNLRACSRSRNIQNAKIRSNRKTSRFKGVCQRRGGGSWGAAIKIFGKRKNLGHYKTEHEAAIAYNRAAESLFGDFCRLNVIPAEYAGVHPVRLERGGYLRT